MLAAAASVLLLLLTGTAIWLARELRASTRLAGRLLAEREAALESGRLLETVVQGSRSGFALLDAGGRVLTINQQALDLIGLRRTDLDERELWTLPRWNADAGARLVRDGCRQAVEGRETRIEIEGQDSAAARVELAFRPVCSGAGGGPRILIEARRLDADLDPERNEVRLVEALAVMSQLASRIAHDINNPLAGIRNCFLLVRDGIPRDHPHYHFVDAIDREIDRLATFSRRLHESFDVRIAADPRPTIRAAAVEASLSVRQPIPPVAVDVELGSAATITAPVPGLALRLVMGNVIQDLVDASDPGGAISVRGDVTDGAVVLRVSASARTWTDRGYGGPGGPGLGIAMFRWFAESLGVRVESTSAKDGSPEVRIHLPSAERAARAIR